MKLWLIIKTGYYIIPNPSTLCIKRGMLQNICQSIVYLLALKKWQVLDKPQENDFELIVNKTRQTSTICETTALFLITKKYVARPCNKVKYSNSQIEGHVRLFFFHTFSPVFMSYLGIYV